MKHFCSASLLLLLSLFALSLASNVRAQGLMQVKVVGKGQPMILLHGMSCSADVWKEVAEHYQDRYQLHLVTLKGFGNDASAETPHYLQQVRDELIAYVKDKKLQKPILMGHSMGGFLSLWAAAEAPALFDKVISVDGLPYFPALQMPNITPEMAATIGGNIRKQMSIPMAPEMRKMMQEQIISTMVATTDKRAPIVAMGLASNPQTTGQAFAEMYTTDLRADMQKVKTPVLVLGAWAAYQQYGATKVGVEVSYRQQLPQGMQLAIAEKAYHFIFVDEPAWFYAQVDGFLGAQ